MKARPKLIAADAARIAARARLFGRVDTLKARLAPGALADEAMNGLADKATDLAGKRPLTFLAAAGILGAILARRPLARWIAGRGEAHD